MNARKRSAVNSFVKSAHIESLESLTLMSAGVTEVEAFHRDGQTFLTWQEDATIEGEQYHVYRHSEAITADNLVDAELLTARWGPLDDDTSRHQLASDGAPQNFVIRDLGPALSDDTGLFVYTTQAGDSSAAFYAVQLVADGQAQNSPLALGSTEQSVAEQVDESSAVLVRSENGGRGLLFTHFMDYRQWNPTFQGYAYNYAVALPGNYDASASYALQVNLHAYNEGARFEPQTQFDWQSIQLFVDDPGADRETQHTWWYGFAADHNYQTDGDIPTSGVIANFTQQRVLKAIDEVIARGSINVDTSRIHAFGHSMGGSGALSFGIHYGNVFSGVYSSQGMTDYRSSPAFQNEFQRLWGAQADNLLIENSGPHAEPISRFNANADATGVWDWLDHGEQLQRRRGDDFALLMFGHGKDDQVIDWESQGRGFVAEVAAANVAFTAEQRDNWGHTWMGFGFAPHTLTSDGFPDLGSWKYRGDISQIAFTNASGSSSFPVESFGTDTWNLNLDWSTAGNLWDEAIVDTPERYEVSVRSLTTTQTVSLTPRRLQQFDLLPGESVVWQSVSLASGSVQQSGTATVDRDGLLTLSDLQVSADGARIVVTRQGASPPAPEPSPEAPANQNPPQTPQPPSVPQDPVVTLPDNPGGSGSNPVGDVRYLVTADTIVSSAESTTGNAGGLDTLSVYAADGGGERVTLLNFGSDLRPLAEGETVTLELHQLNGEWDNGPVEISAFAVNSAWREGSGTNVYASADGASYLSDGLTGNWAEGIYNDTFDFGGEPGVVSTVTVDGYDPSRSVVRIDVTSLVRAWQNGLIANNGLALKITSGYWQEYLFASRESADASLRPALVFAGGQSDAGNSEQQQPADDQPQNEDNDPPASDAGNEPSAGDDVPSDPVEAPPANPADPPAGDSSTDGSPVAATRRAILQDTVIGNTERADANLGGAETLSIFATDGGGQRSSLLQFATEDLTLADGQSAFLELHQLDGEWDNAPVEVSVFAVTTPWEEGTGDNPWLPGEGATALSTGLGGNWQSVGGDFDTTTDFGCGPGGVVAAHQLSGYQPEQPTIRFDITELVRAWQNGLPNYGLGLMVTSGFWTEYLFASSEHPDADRRPALVIV
ncbi:MAG: DNRLRE domain-containing protein [Planctomycetaceae bacterium]|nr:DNRLRE domain-containing protein [Planctomycetaceae bacterium]